jgi:hypothetical protein
MSILRVDAIRDNGSGFNDVVTFANSGGTENGKMARAWVNFDGTGTVAIRAQFNVNSITDQGTGSYRVNFSNALSDANYAAFGSDARDTSGSQVGTFISNISSSSVDVAELTGGTFFDSNNVACVVFR